MAFEKPTFIIFHDPIFAALFFCALGILLYVAKKRHLEIGAGGIYGVFFALFIVYLLIRRIYG